MKKRVLGLDIGIASVGYALIDFDDDFSEGKIPTGEIIKSGVRLFPKAETEDGKSTGEARRLARSVRRRLHSKADRMNIIRNLFVKYNLVKEEDIDVSENNPNSIYKIKKGEEQITPWQLRSEGLDRKLTGKEFAIILTHIAKHRGYKSTRKSESNTSNKELGKLLSGLKTTAENKEKKNYRTLGEMFFKDSDYEKHKRNKANDYTNSCSRDLLKEEVVLLFKTQRGYHNTFASEEFEKEYTDTAFFQKGAGNIIGMLGKCLFEPNEDRAPKDSYSAELFRVLQSLNNLTMIDTSTGEIKKLSNDERNTIINLAHNQKEIKYSTLKNKLNLSKEIRFKSLRYDLPKHKKPKKDTEKQKKSSKEETPEDVCFISMPTYHLLKKTITSKCSPEKWEEISKGENNKKPILDKIVNNIAKYKDDEQIKKAMKQDNIDMEVVSAVLELSFKKFIHLSLKALSNINSFMKDGMTYAKACQQAGYNFKKGLNNAQKEKFLPLPSEEETTTNPVVKRAFAQTRKIINALIREYGDKASKDSGFDLINIELARDLKNSYSDRLEIKKGQEEFQKQKANAKKDLAKEIGKEESEIKDSDVLKYRLWKQQNEHCIYSNTHIKIEQLLEDGFVDIDHIIPYSRCFDDSQNNKVICLAEENRQKGNKTPYEYLTQNGKWDGFVGWLSSMKQLKMPKLNRLLKKEFTKEDSDTFKARNLNDTRYAAIYIKDFIENHLLFNENSNIKKHVNTNSGSMTSILRYKWGFNKNREESHLHHALDAIIVACITNSMVQRISSCAEKIELNTYSENTNNKIQKIKKHKFIFPYPWESFRKDVENSLSHIFVSRAPRHKVTGKAHKETIYSAKHIEKGYCTVKTPITALTLKDLENIHDLEHNRTIYNLLKNRLLKFENKPEKAFAEPVYMPCKNTSGHGPEIKSIKLKCVMNSGLYVRKGIAAQDSMPRVDVYTKNNKYYLVPIYVSDFKKGILPNKAITAGKGEDNWVVIDNTFEFKFSLFKNDLLGLKKKKNDSIVYGYLKSIHSRTGNIEIVHINNETTENFGSKTLTNLNKYMVDILGRYFEIKKEKRLPLQLKQHKK